MIQVNLPSKFWSLLNKVQRCKAVFLIGLLIIGMFLETLGVSLVVPGLVIMSRGDLASNYPMLEPLLAKMGYPSPEELIVLGMYVCVGVYSIKALYLLFLAWERLEFVFGVQEEMSKRLFKAYLHQDYAFHLQRNSAQLIRNTVMEVNLFTQTGMMAALFFLTELMVLIGILVLLIIVEPIGASVVIAALALASFGFNRLTRNHIIKWGESRQHHEGLRIQHIQEGLGGIKEVKLLGREANFVAQYHLNNHQSARAGQYSNTLAALPKLWLELLAVIGLAVLVITLVGQDKTLEAILTTTGLFAAAAFRLLPSVNRILGAVQNVRYALPVINTLYDEFTSLKNSEAGTEVSIECFRNRLVLDKVCYRYPDAATYALKNIELTIEKGSSLGVIGDSGAGKSTLLDIILGLLRPGEDRVVVDAKDIQLDLRGWQNQIGYVPQSIYLTDDTLRRNIAFGLYDEEINEQAILRVIESAQLGEFIKTLPEGLETIVGERGVRLSGGQRQRIAIARALYNDPAVLVMDEATSSLDIDTEKSVMDAVRCLQKDKTIIIIAHRLSTVAQCDKIIRVKDGRIIEVGESNAVLDKVSTGTVI